MADDPSLHSLLHNSREIRRERVRSDRMYVNPPEICILLKMNQNEKQNSHTEKLEMNERPESEREVLIDRSDRRCRIYPISLWLLWMFLSEGL